MGAMMHRLGLLTFSAVAMIGALWGCSGGSNNGGSTPPPPTSYTLTVNSIDPSNGVPISVGNLLNNVVSSQSTSFTNTYSAGTTVLLTAPATVGSDTFTSWSGCSSVSGMTCTVTLNANMTVTVNYGVPPIYLLTVNSSNPSSGVSITASPADNNGKTSGTTGFALSYTAGASVTLVAPYTSGGNTFSSWSGCKNASGTSCSVTINANTTVTANYAAPTAYTLTVNSANPTSGVTISASPSDNYGNASGSTSFTLTYESGTTVTLNAPSAAGGNKFSSWTGCSTSVGSSCSVLLNANTTVSANYTTPPVYTLTVDSASPNSAIAITAAPADNSGKTTGTTPFTLSYNAGMAVTLTAPATSGGYGFVSWTGCTTTTSETCNTTINQNTTVTSTYNEPAVLSVTVSPSPATATIGSTQQFAATVTGTGSYNSGVTWTLAAPQGSTLSPGTISATGLYTTPYPSPATVTVTATSTQNTAISGSTAVTLSAPATASGPALTVDISNQTHNISPLIYGMNAYVLDTATAQNANISIVRWGGDNTSRYNYVANTSNSASDYYFESFTGAGGQWPDGDFNDLITSASGIGAEVVGNAPVIGWITTNNTSSSACSFQKATYPNQQSYNGVCGNGVETNGTNLVGNNTIAAITSMSEPPPSPPGAGNPIGSSWVGTWVASVVSQYGSGNPASGSGKGVAQWDLDNEPEYWSAVHRDVHPNPMTYDEITNGGIGTALAIKTSDPTALVSGPVISGWYQYFYSQQDVNNGYSTGPCYKPWSDPTDRQAHGGVPLIEYYLQQMAAAQSTYGKRLLDYVDIHTYFAADYNGSSTGLTGSGDTGEQQARMNSTRVFWDPTYTDPNYTQPNYSTDPNYTTSCNPPALAPQLIPTLQAWVAKDYPGTKTSIDEYNFGGMESINGAVVEADILGIFGKYGLDKGILWPTTNYSQQVPGTIAFEMYRNYDGNKSTFGDIALASTSTDQGQLSVYGATRTLDGAITVVVINKTYGPLQSTLSIANYSAPAGQNAQVYQYSNANLSTIVQGAAVAVMQPTGTGTSSTITATFPAQSITLFVIP